MNINKLMKQAQEMQKKVTQMQEELAHKEFAGEAGAGLVKVIVNGRGEMLKLTISPELLDPEEVEVLEDLIIAASKDAKKKADDESEGALSDLTGGLGLPPGMKTPF